MTKRIILLGSAMMAMLHVNAQHAYTDKLQTPITGQGQVKIIQSAEIENAVNGKPLSEKNTSTTLQTDGEKAKNKEGNGSNNQSSSSLGALIEGKTQQQVSSKRIKANGYRIQVYAGGNSRTSRQEAQRVAIKVKGLFPDMATYTHFQSPRWLCRVGDFRTYEEANQALHELRLTHQFNEALIVKSVILIAY